MEKNNDLKNFYMSILNETLSSFNELLRYEYAIKVARKGKVYDINLAIHERNFVHLVGIEKLNDIAAAKETPNIYFKLIKNNSYSNYIKEKLTQSKHFYSIVDRLYSIIDLRANFYNAKDNKHYKFISKELGNFTDIKYDFIIKCEYEKDVYYYFLRRDEKSEKANQYVLVSLFINNIVDYSKGQAYMALLEKVEINRSTNKKVIIYKREYK